MRLPFGRSLLRPQYPARLGIPPVRHERVRKLSKLGDVISANKTRANLPSRRPTQESCNLGITGANELEIRLHDEVQRTYPLFWLRDNCPCPECLHPQTKQRLLDTFAIPPDVRPAFFRDNDNGVHITWDHGAHRSFYPWPWLRDHSPFVTAASAHHWEHVKPNSPFPTTPYSAIMSTASTSGLAQWLNQIRRFGFSFVSDCPPNPESTEQLLTRIAFIRPTHYGAFWDFTSSANPTDTAYTTLALPVHTDTTYFTDPCGLQMFHLLSHNNGSGGASTLVDGFAAAEYLFQSDEKAYAALSRRRIVSHASGDESVGSIDNTATHEMGLPVLEHALGTKPRPGILKRVRWNNDDRAVGTAWQSKGVMEEWYAAARKWVQVLRMREFEIEVQLEPGKPVIFDNWRVLHGRRGFSGERRVCGGYVGMDDFLARWRSLGGGQEGEDGEGEGEDGEGGEMMGVDEGEAGRLGSATGR